MQIQKQPLLQGFSPEKLGDVHLAVLGHLLSPLPLLLLHLILLFICLGHLPVLQEPGGRELTQRQPLKPKHLIPPIVWKENQEKKLGTFGLVGSACL